MDDDTSIKVSKATRARLNQLADERGVTVRNLVEQLAGASPTAEELAAREVSARNALQEHFSVTVGDDELAAAARLRSLIEKRSAA